VLKNQGLLFCLMIVLVLSGVPNVECSTNDTIGEIHTLDVGGVDPPTIGWMFPENATLATGMEWDSGYTGQTELTWSYSSWVNDSDVVDSVFFQYRYRTSGPWMNRTPSMVSGDSTNGEYSYTFVQEISWNWDTNRPEVEGGLYVAFRIYANDTLGNWRTTLATSRSGGWLGILTPSLFPSPLASLVIVLVSVTVVALIVVIRRRQQ